jgi:hypothetical protein
MPGDLVGVAVGGGIGLVGGLATQWVTHLLQSRYRKKSVAAAFRGEISAILKIIEHRNYLSAAEAMIKAAETQNVAPVFHLNMRHNYFAVYDANCTNIGLLAAKDAEDVAAFYTIAKSLTEDISGESSIEVAALLKEQVDMAKRLITIGKQLHDRLV